MFKKILSLITSAAIVAAVLVSCSCSGDTKKVTSSGPQPNAKVNSAVDGQYQNEVFKYKLTIPSEIKDDISINGNEKIVTIYNTYVKGLGAKNDQGTVYEGKLGTIWAERLESSIPYEHFEVLGKDSERQYVFQYPEEDQYNPKDKKAKENFENTKKYLKEILDSFTLG